MLATVDRNWDNSTLFYYYITTTFVWTFLSQDGISPLHVACLGGDTDVVDLLVQAGADIHLASTDKVYLLLYIQIFPFSWNCETNFIVVDLYNILCLLLFLINVCTSALKSVDYIILSHLSQYGSDCLMIAATKGHTATVQRLLEAGATVNHKSKVNQVPS